MGNNSEIKVFCLFIIVVSIFWGCSNSYNPNVKHGSSYSYKQGYPEVRFSAIGRIDEAGNPQINIAADIVYGSLIYSKKENQYTANIAIDVQVVDRDEPDNIIQSKRFPIEINKQNSDITYSQEQLNFQKTISVEPGKYKVNFRFTDLSSEKKIVRSANTYIPDPKSDVINLTNIQLKGKDIDHDNPKWAAITTYDVQKTVDSLKFIFQATNNSSEEPLTISSKLMRIDSDTSAAKALHFNNASSSSIRYKGIDYSDKEVLETNRRKLLQSGNVLIEFKFERKERGSYRFKVAANKDNGEFEEQTKARDFGVKSKNYPSVKTPRELARPLVYVMKEDNYENLISITDPDSLKQAIDRFWLKHIGNKSETKSVIKKYYNRVVEANKQFSNFKEGWKTDPGMMYILFGPPWYVDQSLDKMKWSYSYNRSDPERNFYYKQPKLNNKFYPFDHYLLRRSQNYFNVQYQQIQLWLSGLILQRNI